MRIEIPPLHLTPPVTSGYVSDIVANQQLRQQELDEWQLSITSKYEVAEGRPATIFDALIGHIDDPTLVLMNHGRKVKLVRVEGVKQHKAEGWSIVICEFNKPKKKNIAKWLSGEYPPPQEPLEVRQTEYEALKAKYYNNLIYNPARFIWR